MLTYWLTEGISIGDSFWSTVDIEHYNSMCPKSFTDVKSFLFFPTFPLFTKRFTQEISQTFLAQGNCIPVGYSQSLTY